MTFAELKSKVGNTLRYEWIIHRNGGGFKHFKARVSQTAYISSQSIVYGTVVGNARVMGRSLITKLSSVLDCAVVDGDAQLLGQSKVIDHALVSGNVVLTDNSTVKDNARVFGNVYVAGNSVISESSLVYGKAVIRGNTVVGGNEVVSECAIADNLIVERYKTDREAEFWLWNRSY